ncbi:hypothetical protein DCAR_0207538 [Daucus carota subsp. sativus]|uniref:Uncharacterized protein n=1 Tax=Daucus carota subsp. sativus TaxID=79200 RepID=A0A166DZ03_DAUCS|nr:PREDICTED: E3 ubiquitin-protein ligase RNF170-like isoform X2 [Daucus carota subsp. sativus]WOG88303.1 hypothetical protein DCAR_0207538 [Daucus carota subsp. sativus]
MLRPSISLVASHDMNMNPNFPNDREMLSERGFASHDMSMSPNFANEGSSDSVSDFHAEQVNRDTNDAPPLDDVCPICFDVFTVPCKTNCGHWFCGSCIMQFWHYKATVKRCKCPICSRLISVLTPEACLLGRQEKEVVDVLKNVHRYNCLFQGGFGGLLQNVLAIPFLIKRIFQGLMDPDRFRINYYTARLFGLMLGVLYNISPFNFIPTGGYAAHRVFELCAILLVVVLCFIGLCCRAISRRRWRRLVAAHNWNDL